MRISKSMYAAAAALCLCAVGAAPLAAPAAADAMNNPYSATASAAALKLSVHDPQIVPFLAGGGFDITSPSSQAAADTLGGGRAVASLVYPGDDIAGITQMVAMFAPQGVTLPNLPDWPVTVIAQPGNTDPKPDSTPLYDLQAKIGDGLATASSSGGFPGFGVKAISSDASATPTDDGGVQAVGTTTAGLLSFGKLLQVGTVTSEATASRTSDGTLKRSSSLTITGASLAGLPLDIKDGQLEIPALGSLLPLGDALNALPLLKQQFTAQGLSIGYVPEKRTSDGVIAPSIQINYTVKTPAIPIPAVDLPNLIPAQPAVGPLPPSTFTFSVTLGAAEAHATLTPLPSFDSGTLPPVAVTPPAAGGSVAPTTVASAPASAPVAQAAAAPIDTGSGGVAQVQPASSAPAATPASTTQPAAQATPTKYRVTAATFSSAGSFYLALILIAAVGLVISQLARFGGVKTPWKS